MSALNVNVTTTSTTHTSQISAETHPGVQRQCRRDPQRMFPGSTPIWNNGPTSDSGAPIGELNSTSTSYYSVYSSRTQWDRPAIHKSKVGHGNICHHHATTSCQHGICGSGVPSMCSRFTPTSPPFMHGRTLSRAVVSDLFPSCYSSSHLS